jgi:hypothetical protein
MMLETMKELFGITHNGEEEVPNAKRMRIGEEEVSLSQPVTVAVLQKEEEVPVPQGPTIMVSPEEEEVPVLLLAPLSWSRKKEGDALLSQSMTRAPMMKALYRPW